MQKLMTKHFKKWSHKEKIDDKMLVKAIENLKNNLSSASLGKGLYKIRVAMRGQGKRGSFRTLVVYQTDDRAVFVYGFKKSEKENLSTNELTYWQEFANTLLAFNEKEIQRALNVGQLFKIKEDENA